MLQDFSVSGQIYIMTVNHMSQKVENIVAPVVASAIPVLIWPDQV